MPFLHNLQRTKKLRQHLRNNATASERILWEFLRQRRLNGLKFRRQHSVRGYIVDFYCSEIRLAIEIDGHVHALSGRKEYDQHRQDKLERLGVRFFRCTAQEVHDDAPRVADRIRNFIFPTNKHNHPLSPSSHE